MTFLPLSSAFCNFQNVILLLHKGPFQASVSVISHFLVYASTKKIHQNGEKTTCVSALKQRKFSAGGCFLLFHQQMLTPTLKVTEPTHRQAKKYTSMDM